MKQREFVVVLLRLFAVWIAVQAIINFVQGVAEPSVREGTFMSLAFIVAAQLLILGLAAMIWIKSEPLMRRAYAGSETWDTYPAEFEEVSEVEGASGNASPVLTAEIEQPEFYEPTTAFSDGITMRDILLGFLVALGLWLLVNSLPRIILLAVSFAMMPAAFGEGASRQATQQLIYWAVQAVIGIVLLKPANIVNLLWKFDAPAKSDFKSPEAQSAA